MAQIRVGSDNPRLCKREVGTASENFPPGTQRIPHVALPLLDKADKMSRAKDIFGISRIEANNETTCREGREAVSRKSMTMKKRRQRTQKGAKTLAPKAVSGCRRTSRSASCSFSDQMLKFFISFAEVNGSDPGLPFLG